ncbi:MAG: hypothetical protein OZ913_05955 [Ignavibacteriaceae bacterium]|jgi:hypothetical protein|nr:hypothetical protein [Chlorobi bacterium CHB7]MEB2329829.1 hypothetical protein [Ignavibacteriaceae bacterium]OQY77446.1 MAG: hypothetical protein B6D43_07475 [Ignavibacteriales bacterium UTCHB1]RIK48048.1 MAG: hypothetical protein DCC60_08605 [Ignavibacteriota bacterium]
MMNLKLISFSLVVFVFIGIGFAGIQKSEAGTHSIEQSRKKKRKNNKGVSSFGRAYREAVKKGLSTFTWNGKKYTTENKSKNTSQKNVTSRNNKNTTKSYSGVSFGSAYRDAKKRGLSTFKWNGKLYTTSKNTNVSNRTSKKIKRKKRVTRRKRNKVNRNRKVTRRTNRTTNNNTGTYNPPKTYENDNSSGRTYERSEQKTNSGTEFIKKEPKRE